MPLGGGSGEGGLAARGYNGPAQPGGNYGGTNVVGTGGGFLGDRSAINNAVLAAKNPSTSSGTQTKTYKVVTDPITGKKTKVLTSINGKPVFNSTVDPLNPFPPVPGEFNPPIPQPRPVHTTNWRGGDMYGGNIYSNAPYGGWTEHVDFGKDPSRVDTPGKDPGRLNQDSGQATGPGGMFGGQDTPSGDMSRSMSMMAAPMAEQPLVSPGPIGPGGQPMGNRPPPFQWGARDLALRHGLEQMMRHRQQMARRPQYGRNEHVQRILRAAARRGRA